MLFSVMVPMLGMSFFLKSEISESILVEKRDKLFGLARQLDAALEGSYDDILAEEGALDADRDTKIAVLNARLRGITVSGSISDGDNIDAFMIPALII